MKDALVNVAKQTKETVEHLERVRSEAVAEFKKLTSGMAAAGPAAILNTGVSNRLDMLEAPFVEGKAHQDKESEK